MSVKKIESITLSIDEKTTLYHAGPSLEKGAYPAIFYFALSGIDTLCRDPFNQPVQFLSDEQIRIFTITLPYHQLPIKPEKAIDHWVKAVEKEEDLFLPFFEEMDRCFDYLDKKHLLIKDRLATCGLSRGGFFALHTACRYNIDKVVAFAPVTDLQYIQELSPWKESEIIQKYQLHQYTEKLAKKHIRFYIGNNDTRVSTKQCFQFMDSLVQSASKQNIRSPQIEMIISPSIGHKGHGTPPEIFKQGANFLAELLQ